MRYSGKIYFDEGYIEGVGIDITEEKEKDRLNQERLSKINECFLRFGTNPLENIQSLIGLCGDMLGASVAIYNRLEGEWLVCKGGWQIPTNGFKGKVPAAGRICYDIITSGDDEARVVRDLPNTPYAATDPSILKFGLMTYIGKAVKCGSSGQGSLCVLYNHDFDPGENELKVMSIVASAIGIEEERRRVQAEHSRFALGIERSGEAVFLTDVDGRIVYVNPAFEKIYGYSQKEVLGLTPRILKSGVVPEEVYRIFWDTLLSKKIVSGEIINRAKDGRLLDIDASANPVLDDDGNIIGFLAIQRDITERKRAQGQLEVEKANLEQLIESAPEAIVLANKDCKIARVNSEFTRLFGYAADEALGRCIDDLLAPGNLYEHAASLTREVIDGNRVNLETVRYRKDGTPVHVSILGTPIKAGDGPTATSYGIYRDITERKKAEEALRESEERFRRIFEEGPLSMATAGADFRFITANAAFCKMVGYTEEELRGLTFKDITQPDHLEKDIELVEELYYGRISLYRTEKRYIRKTGEIVWGSATISAIRDHEGNFQYFLAMVEDITQRRRAEEALRESEKFLTNIFDGIQDGICVLNKDFEIIHVNKTMEKWYSHSLPLIGQKCHQAYHGRGVPCVTCPTLNALDKGTLQVETVPLVVLGEIKGWLELFAYPLVDDKGEITGVIEYVRDITKRRRVEEAATARTEFLSALVGLTDAAELAHLAFQHVRRLVPVEAAGLIVPVNDGDNPGYEIIYSADTSDDGRLDIDTDRHILELYPTDASKQVFSYGQKVVIHRRVEELDAVNIHHDNSFAFNMRKSRSLAFLPLKVHGRTIGVFSFHSYQPDIFDEYRVSLMESAMADLALALTAVRMSEAFKEGEERYRIMAEQTGQMIYDYDVASGRIKWSGAIEAITGYTTEEYQKVDVDLWEKLIHPEDRELASELLAKAMNDGSIYIVEYRLKCKDNSYIYVADNGVFIKDKTGKATRMLGTMKDVSENRMAKEMLQKSEEKYRKLIETMPNGLGFIDLDGNLVYANPSACQILGYSQGEVLGMNVQRIIPEEDALGIQEAISSRKTREQAGEHTERERAIIRKDGQKRILNIIAGPHCDESGHITGTIVIFTDVTDVKNSEAEKQELRDKLARAQRMESLGVLAGGVAHDLNNILGPLVAYPEVIRLKLPPDSPALGHIKKIEASAQRAAEVVQDLLTMARRGRYEMSPVSLNKIVESYLQSPGFYDLKSRFPSVLTDIKLGREVSSVIGSEPHLYKVIMNLVTNALDAMPHGGVLSVTTECRHIDRLIGGYDNIESGLYTILTVSDTGIGIEQKDLRRLFEPFYTKKEMGKSGSGLGLAIVYGVVKDHNGYIDVHSEPNMGSDFIIYIPATSEEARADKTGAINIRGGERILVVDDVIEQRELAATILGSLGYKVEVAANGHEAVKFMAGTSADVVVLDMIMEPGFDGLDTYREILKLHPGQKAIITSGFSETDRVKEAERLGAGRYIKKPYTMQKLGKAIREVLDLRAQ